MGDVVQLEDFRLARARSRQGGMAVYPPRNRQAYCLPAGIVEITDACGPRRFTFLEAHSAAFLEILDLRGTVEASFLSGEPGYVYNSGSVRVSLTEGELLALMGGCLTRAQYARLVDHFGLFVEIREPVSAWINATLLGAEIPTET